MKRYWLKHKKLVFISIVLILLSSLAQVLFDFAKGALLDQAVLKAGDKFSWLSLALLTMLLVKAFTFYGYTKNIKYFSVYSIADMRQGIFSSLLRSGYPRFIQRKAGEIYSLYTNQLDTIEGGYFNSFYGSFQILASLFMSLSGLFLINWKLALLASVVLVPPVFVPRLLKKRLDGALVARLRALEKNTGHFSQWMDAKDVIRNFQAEERFLEAFQRDTRDIQIKTEKYNQLSYLSHSFATLLSQIGLLALIAFSAYSVLQGKLTVGMFLTSIALMQEMQGQVIYQAGYMQQIMSSKVATDEVLTVVDEVLPQPDIQVTLPVDIIQYKDLTFGYSTERTLLKEMNLFLDQKGLYLVTGESGSGKSTAMNLLAGYYKPDLGSVSINEVNSMDVANLSEIITVMRQEASFFTDTLRNNLTMYKQHSDEEIIRLMRELSLEKYANRESLDMIMSSEADQFSGGEARRLSLVRSLLKSSEILILDEPLANVDEDTIQKIIHLILSIKDRYVFMITHQLPEELKQHALGVIKVS